MQIEKHHCKEVHLSVTELRNGHGLANTALVLGSLFSTKQTHPIIYQAMHFKEQ